MQICKIYKKCLPVILWPGPVDTEGAVWGVDLCEKTEGQNTIINTIPSVVVSSRPWHFGNEPDEQIVQAQMMSNISSFESWKRIINSKE